MKHNILKSLFISVILLAGTSNVWAGDFQGQGTNAGWFANDGLILTWSKNGSSATTKMNYSSMSSGGNLGDITTELTLTKMEAKFWRTYHYGNICEATIFWDLYKEDTHIAGSSEVSSSFGNWSEDKNCSITKTLSIDLYSKTTGPGSYTIRVYGKLTGRSQDSYYNDVNYLGCGDNFWYNNNQQGYYSITFTIPSKNLTVANDGNGTTTGNVNGITKGNSYTITATANAGYTFEKWTKASGGNSISIADVNSASTTVTFNDYANDGKVTASFTANTYTVTLDNQGATTAGTASVTATYNSAMPSIANNLPKKTGYTFGGYYTSTNGSGTKYYNADGSSAKNWDKTTATTLYAQWTPDQYNITYKDEGNATFSGTHETGYPTTHTYSTATTLKSATKTGYTFGGWYTSSDCTGSAITTLGATAYTAAITLYAKWSPISYDINYTAPTNGTYTIQVGSKAAVSANTTANYNETITLTNTPKKGYKFDEWTITPIVSITNSMTFRMPANDVTIAATFTPITYTITYNLNGGSGTMTPTEYNVTTETFNLPTPTRTGYTFDGWYSDAEFTGEKVTTIAKGTTGNIELYAKWSETKYSVNINTNNRNWGITTPSGANWVGATPVNLIATHHTGYHFVNWTATGGARIADPNLATTTITATASGTVTAHFAESLYKITVQSSNPQYGTVSQSAPKAGVSTAITITAEPKKEGYEFTGWSKDGDITIASINSATTTLTATGEGTVTANFAPKGSTPIYFKANHAWTADKAWFAVYYWNANNVKGWSILNPICGSDYYKAEVPAGYTGFKFVRFRPSTDNTYVPDNGGLNWSNDWNESYDLVVPTDGKTMFDTKKVYLKPNGNWKTDNMRFAAYFYDDSNNEKWMSLELTSIDGVYTCDIPTEYEGEKDYKYVIFCRMDPSKSDNNWSNCKNKTVDLQLFNDSEGIKSFDKNCFTLGNDQWGKDPNNDKDNNSGASGTWSLINDEATYNVTLYSCSFGEYGFIYNNVEYTSPESGSITYQIPINATVKVFSRPYSKAYRGDVMVKQGEDTRWEISPDNPLLNITCNTILDDNYKTTGEHEVYLAVPQDGGNVTTTWWYQIASHTNYIYAFHHRTEEGKGYSVKMEEVGTAKVNNQLHTYYRCVIPAEVNTIRFEKHLTSDNSNKLQTIDLTYDIPLNSVNCYRLDRPADNKKAGLWEPAPGFNGDYRVICQRKEGEKVVEYASDIIRHGTISQTVSLHIYTIDAGDEYPKLELQQHNGTEWVTISGQTKLVKDINKIMSDPQDDGCGVWNFTVTTDGADKAEVNFNTPQRYTGNYYIRTNNAEGQWRNYTLNTNLMTFSSYAKHHSGYSHYFCKWVDINMLNDYESSKLPGHNNNVKFIIANDYGAAISKEMAEDEHTATGGILPQDANVRWTWDEATNAVSRAYILGAYDPDNGYKRNENIVVKYTTGVKDKMTLNDQENWIYEIDLTDVKVDSKLTFITATYPSQDMNVQIDKDTQKLVKARQQSFAEDLSMLAAEEGNDHTYTVRVMYDFKINKTLVMLLPDKNYDSHTGVDVFIDRTDQGIATQVQPGATVTSSKDEGYTVYSTLTLTQDHLTSTTKTEWERLYYWISFPFDVRISEIFGFGEYGKHYIIEYYDGAARAENGCWADSPTYWRQITDTTYSARREADNKGNEDANGNPNNGILVANKGYVLALARNIAKSDIFKYGNEYVRLYFPSREKIKSIDADMQETTVYLRPHTCNITREDRYIYDSNWHIIGVPSYANKEQILKEKDVLYFYTYKTADNTYAATSAKDATVQFNSMHAYMVQYTGYINWKSWSLTQEPQSVVARRQSAETQEDYALRLELQRDDQYADQAFVQLKAEGATADFDMNQDLTKIINAGANIYTLAGEKRIQVAGNVLPIAKTTIPVGIQVAQAGTYTIALPDGTSGISATLVDNQTGTHTNLLLEDYTITLDAGSHENRFYIVLDPERSATAVENIGDAQGDKTQKFLIDGQLIIRTEQGVYDATGGKVK